MEAIHYAIIGFLIVIFLFEIVIVWYMWWFYNQVDDNYNDLNSMIIDIYNLEVLEAKENKRDVVLRIPKRSHNAYLKRNKEPSC